MKNQPSDATDKPHPDQSEPIPEKKPNDTMKQPSPEKDSDKAEREQERQLESGEENPT